MTEWEFQALEDRPHLESIEIAGGAVRAGSRVRLKPRGPGDVFDLALSGKIAIIESIEQDYDGEVQIAVVLDEDPGRDLGMLRQPGHRFFFRCGEVEVCES